MARNPIQIDRLIAHEVRVERVLEWLLKSRRRARAVILGMRLQGIGGECFASGSFLMTGRRRAWEELAFSLGTSMEEERRKEEAGSKAWDRTLAKLKKLGLVQVWRRRRENGFYSTNEVSYERLWRWIVRQLGALLQSAWARVREVVDGGNYLLFKFTAHDEDGGLMRGPSEVVVRRVG